MDVKLKDGTIITIFNNRILINDVTFSHEYNPHNIRPWVIFNEFGAICLSWAGCEQYALDESDDIDKKLLHDGFYTHLGDADELTDLSNCSIKEIDLNSQDIKFIIALAEARGGAGYDSLELS